MELIIDANILMSALISTEGKTFDLIFNNKIKLFAPDYLIDEITKHKELILKKSGLSNSDFDLFLSLVSSKIEIISKNKMKILN
jgi:predicted nucleic acid-binding protein